MVKVSVDLAVTLTISALLGVGISLKGLTTTLNSPSVDGSGNLAPCPDVKTKVVPESGGSGGVKTVP